MKKSTFLLMFSLLYYSFSQNPTSKDIAVEVFIQSQSNPPTFTINWINNTSSQSYQVSKKLKSNNTWTVLANNLSGSVTSFVDNNVSAGVEYEYRVIRSGQTGTNSYYGYGYTSAGIEIQPVHFRGKCILMIANTLTPGLTPEINRFIQDLEGDGWQVKVAYTATNSPVTSVKNQIHAIYQQDTINTKCLILLGRVPVPYSGAMAPDAHPDHYGAWPADVYYADIKNGIWTDLYANTTPTNSPRIVNVPGDGKFDQSFLQDMTELQIGRIDLSSMPAFTVSENQLLKNYLDKNHDYRVVNFSVQPAGVIDDGFGYFYGEAFGANGWRNFSSLVGPSNVIAADYFTTLSNSSNSRLWSYGCGGGTYQSASGIGHTTTYATSNLNGVFTILFGSYFGDWDVTNSFLRAPLCQGKMLTSFWAGRPNWWLHHMGLGETIGYSAWITQNNPLNSFYSPGNAYDGGVHVALMGDPTLRQRMVIPPQNVTATFNNHDAIINWSPSTQTNVLGYHIYMKNDSINSYIKINNLPVTGTSFTHICQPYQATYTYMVRAMVLENTFSGTYYNLSQGITDTAYHASNLIIYATPSVINTSTPTTFQFSVNASPSFSYSWNFGDGNLSFAQNPMHTYTANGNYIVQLNISNGCHQQTYTLSVNVINVGILKYYDVLENNVHVYPIPSKDLIHITINGVSQPSWIIKNLYGQIVYASNENKCVISASKINMKSGLYFIEVIDAVNNNLIRKKIIVVD